MNYRTGSMQEAYPEIVARVLEGDKTFPRGRETREILDFQLILEDPELSLPTGVGRGLNTGIAAVEAIQLMGAALDPQAMLRATSHFSEFMDAGTFHGGYGPRIRMQLPKVLERLREDPHTRRAVMTLWDPMHDLFVDDSHDYPCTISVQFTIRDDLLHAHTHMRSNDVWRGLPYDVFQFCQLQLMVAAILDYGVGSYHHHTTSLHVYATDFKAAEGMLNSSPSSFKTKNRYPSLFKTDVDLDTAQRIARNLLACGDRTLNMPGRYTDPEMEEWYASRLG